MEVKLFGIIGWVIAIYNGLIRLRNEVKNAWSQIDVQLKRRYDLIPNLVETAKGYMTHERETLEAVTKARQQAVDFSGGVADQEDPAGSAGQGSGDTPGGPADQAADPARERPGAIDLAVRIFASDSG